MSSARLRSWEKWPAAAAIAVLAVSGLGQMPIFKRYYVADLLGLAWTADYYLLHTLHYLAAVVLLLLVTSRLPAWLAWWRGKSRPAWLRLGQPLIFLGLVATGLARTAKNLPEVSLSPDLVLAIDLGHLLLAMLFGLFALLARTWGAVGGKERLPGERRTI